MVEAEGTVLGEVYTLRRKIGDGGMAEVYLADVDVERFDYTMLYAYTQVQGKTHIERFRRAEEFARELQGEELDINTVRSILKAHKIPLPAGQVAVKLARDGLNNDRFMAEWKGLVCLHHENVIQVYGGGMHGEKPFYAMEVLPTILSNKEIASFSMRDKIDYIIQGARGLQYLHEHGIIHRDVKPDNLLAVRRDDGGFVVKVSDLGIAKGAGEVTGMTMTTAVMGTPCFMSPEQAKSSKNVDERADVYSLGASLYKLVTNTLPYAEKTSIFEIISAISSNDPPKAPREINPDLPEDLAQIIQCAMAFDTDQRYASMDELIHDLEEFIKTMGTVTMSADTNVLHAKTIVGMDAAADSLTATASGDKSSTKFIFQTRTSSSLAASTVDTAGATVTTVTPGGATATLPGVEAATIAQTQAEIQVQKAARNLVRLTVLSLLLIVSAAAYFGGWFSRRPAPPPAGGGGRVIPEGPGFDELYARAEKLYLAGTPEDLSKAEEVGKQALAIARSRAERMSLNSLLAKVDAKRLELEREQEYRAHLRQARQAQAAKDYDRAREQAKQALALRKSKEATDMLHDIERLAGFKQKYDQAVTEGQRRMNAGEYAAAAASFSLALRVHGYEKDPVAAKGLANARKAQYDAAMVEGQQAAGRKHWEEAVRCYQEALAVPGYEKAQEPRKAIETARAKQTSAELGKAFAGYMQLARELADKGKWLEAEKQFARALAVKGFEKNPAALAGLARARAARFRASMDKGKADLAKAAWKDAIVHLRAALAVPGYEQDQAALKSIARARRNLQGAAWKAGAPPPVVSEQALPGLSAAQRVDRGIRRTMPEMCPSPPFMYGYFVPRK